LLSVDRILSAAIDALGRYGFADVDRVIAEYWNAYGEMPPFPPRKTKRSALFSNSPILHSRAVVNPFNLPTLSN
jgi:hypothetical protein